MHLASKLGRGNGLAGSRSRGECILFQGVFSADELYQSLIFICNVLIHQSRQLHWLLDTPLATKIKIWVKVDTGMHRLGFAPEALSKVLSDLAACPWSRKN